MPETALELIENVGAVESRKSLLAIKSVPNKTPELGDDNVKSMPSPDSSEVSKVTGTLIVAVVMPAANVNVPPVAVTPVPCTATVPISVLIDVVPFPERL
jgi:hypothetical protein